MFCDACNAMLVSVSPTPHSRLIKSHTTRLRPLGRSPTDVCRYRCLLCGANWMSESDASVPGEQEWICLYHSSNILEPGSLLASASQADIDPPAIAHVNAGHAVVPKWPYRVLTMLGSLPFM